MKVEVCRFGKKRPIVLLIDGAPYLLSDAAEKLGLKAKTLEKRIQRGTPPISAKPRRGNWLGLSE